MAITTLIDKQYGTSPGSEGQNVANLNLGSVDQLTVTPASHPITAGNNSYELWCDMRFTGTANQVDNLKVWISAGTLDAEADLKTNARESVYGGAETYTTPIETTSTIADQDMPTSEPTGANLGIGGALAGNHTTFPNNSDYLLLQYQASASHPAGNITQLTLTFQWDEQ